MNERDRQGLEDILEFAERAIRILGSRDLRAFAAEEAVLYSIRYCILVIGETAGALSPEAMASAPGVPWPQVVAMRHRLAHNYRAVTDAIVYQTVIEDLPLLRLEVRRVLSSDPE